VWRMLHNGALVARVEEEQILWADMSVLVTYVTEIAYYSKPAHSAEKKGQKHQSRYTRIKMMSFGEDNRVGLKKKIETTVCEAHIYGDGDKHWFTDENHERLLKDVIDPLREANVILLFHGRIVILIPSRFA
jgi:hypothetical protein